MNSCQMSTVLKSVQVANELVGVAQVSRPEHSILLLRFLEGSSNHTQGNDK